MQLDAGIHDPDHARFRTVTSMSDPSDVTTLDVTSALRARVTAAATARNQTAQSFLETLMDEHDRLDGRSRTADVTGHPAGDRARISVDLLSDLAILSLEASGRT